MKKFGLFLLALCNVAHAHLFVDEFFCRNTLNIIIKNHSNQTCFLDESNIKLGNFSTQNIQTSILAGTESTAYSFENLDAIGPDVVLTYSCGDEKSVSLESRRFETLDPVQTVGKPTKVNEHIFGSILSISNMQASFKVFTHQCNKNIPGTIIWTIE